MHITVYIADCTSWAEIHTWVKHGTPPYISEIIISYVVASKKQAFLLELNRVETRGFAYALLGDKCQNQLLV